MLSFSWVPAVREKRYTQDCAHAKGSFRRMSRRISELGVKRAQCSSRPMLYMCSEERDFECPGGLWRPRIRFFSLPAYH